KNKQLVLITTSFFTGCRYKQPYKVQIWTDGAKIKRQLNQRKPTRILVHLLFANVTGKTREKQKSQNFPAAHQQNISTLLEFTILKKICPKKLDIY
ncbi:MAG: hypothetical protein LC111_05475, partial [Bacteroidia bacterium]|nr:hypothetical protein [Bacteroidia bacterium]